MEEERTETQAITYEIVKDANIGRFFAYDLQAEDDGFWLDDEDNVMGAVVRFASYPTHKTLIGIFDDLLVKAVMQTQDVDEDEACELVQDCEDEDDYPEFVVSSTFSRALRRGWPSRVVPNPAGKRRFLDRPQFGSAW